MNSEERLKDYLKGYKSQYEFIGKDKKEHSLNEDIEEILNQNQQLKERLDKMSEKEYLEYRDELQLHGTRELAEEVIRLEKENQQLKDNWNKLEEYLTSEIRKNKIYDKANNCEWMGYSFYCDVLYKVQEIQRGDESE